MIYYSDSLPDQDLLVACRRQLRRAAGARPIVAVTLPAHGVNGFALGDPSFEGMEHVVLPKARGYLTMFEQILTALRLLSTDYVHFAEHDVLYSAEHFDEVPAGEPFAYNTNVWKVDARTGRALHYICEQTSGLSGRRDHLIDHYERRIAHVKAHGFTRRMGFEPGKEVRHGGIDGVPRWPWQSSRPNVDIRHGANLTPSRWSRDQFRNPKYTKGWTEADAVPSWGQTAGRFPEWLAEVTTHG